MSLIPIAKAMSEKIKLLPKKIEDLKAISIEKAASVGAYEKQMALVIIQLKNGVEFTLDGVNVVNPIGTLTEKIAKGICSEEKIRMDLAESQYKVALTEIEAIKAQLNGMQSINKYLKDEV